MTCDGARMTQKPVAWRYRSKDEPKWEYSEKKLISKDFFRKEPGFEEQPLYASQLPPHQSQAKAD